MILSNLDIQGAIDAGDLLVEPEPLPRRGVDCPYDTTAVNLHLGDWLSVPKEGKPIAFDLRRGRLAPFLAEVYEDRRIDEAGGYALQRDRFVLGQTRERVTLPIRDQRPCLAARIEGRSSFARCGLIVHFTAPTIHAGFDGRITLEMKNLGPYPIMLYPGLEIAQLVLEGVSGTPLERHSQFQGQVTPTGPRP